MKENEKIEREMYRHINAAPAHQKKEIKESIEWHLAMKEGNVSAAYDIAYGIIHGSGKTKAESKRNAKRIKKRGKFLLE